MDVHDIRYLHDESFAEKKKADSTGRFTLTQRSFAGIVLVFLVAGIGLTVFNISKRTSTESSASNVTTSLVPSSVPMPTVRETQLEGTVTCLPSDTARSAECDIALATEDGMYALQNVLYEDVVAGELVPGKKTVVSGTLATSGKSGGVAGVLYITAVGSGGGGSGTGGSDSQTPTATITLTPSPTPLPYSVPTPSVQYLTVKHIVDNKDELAGEKVFMGAFVVTEQQLQSGCPESEQCTEAHYIVNDAVGSGRDTFYDTTLETHVTSEGQVLFTPGQKIYAEVVVNLVEDTVVLLLNILD